MAVLSDFGPRLKLPRWRETRPAHLALFLLMVVALSAPLGFLVLGSFSQAKLPGDIDLFTLGLDNYRAVWGSAATYTVFFNTIVYALGAVSFGVPLAALLAWLVERTNLPFKVWIYAGVPLCLAIPGMLQSMAY